MARHPFSASPVRCAPFKRRIITACLPCLFLFSASAQTTTATFARYPDGTVLQMDIYQPAGAANKPKAVILHVFGGGFFTGSRTDTIYQPYFRFLLDKGFTVAAIDYRLGLKGVRKGPSLFNRKPLIRAISLAVEDVYSATAYLLQHAKELNIDTGNIILSGSSAGAVTVLQSDYEKRNSFPKASVLPRSFQYAGVIAFAGALYSTEGKPDYAIAPAPALLFHGDKDNIVPYGKISLLGTGLFGSKAIAAKRKKDGYPYAFYSFEGLGHDASVFPMHAYQQEVYGFIRDLVLMRKPLFIDVTIKDANRKNTITGTLEEFMRRQR